MVVDDAGDGGPSMAPPRRRRRRGGGEAGRGAEPLAMTWPSGCSLDWQERERIGQAALQRCSQRTADRGTTGTRRRRTPPLANCLAFTSALVVLSPPVGKGRG